MTIRNVSSYGELLSALSASSDGDEIVCSPANYGDVNLYARIFSGSNPLIIRGSDTRTYGVTPGASFGTITCHGGTSGITFRNLNAYIITANGAYLTVEQCRIYGYVGSTNSVRPIVRQTEFPHSAVFMTNAADFLVEENFFYQKHGDMMNASGSSCYGSFLNNAGFDIRSESPQVDPHWDFIQSHAGGGLGSPASLHVRGNLFIDNPATIIELSGGGAGESEGILLGDEFDTLTAEQNLIWCQNANGLTVANPGGGGFNNNTVVTGIIIVYTDASYGKTYNFPVDDNIAGTYHDNDGAAAPTFSGNVAPATGLISTANTLDWTMFENAPGYTDKGAYTRYQEIVAGINAEAIAMGAALVGWTEPGDGSSVVTKTSASPAAIAMTGYPATVEAVGAPPPSISGLTINLASA